MMAVDFFKRYGFGVVFLFCFGVFAPVLSSKMAMMDLDLDTRSLNKSGSNIIKQLFWLGMFAFYLMCFLNDLLKGKRNFELEAKARYFVILVGISLLTVVWSEYPSYVIKRSLFQLIFTFTVALSFYYSVVNGGIEKVVSCSSYIVMFLIGVTVVLGVAFSGDGALVGFSKGKNVLAANLFVLIFLVMFLVGHLKADIYKFGILLLLMSLLLVMTMSKTNIAVYFSLCISLLFSVNKIKLGLILSCLFLYLVFIFIPSVSYFFGDAWHLGLVLDHEALTGRGFIWDTLYYDLGFYEKMAFGYGYGSYFNVGVIPYFFDDSFSFIQYITSAHNGYIGLMMQFGFWLSSLVFIVFLLLLKGVDSRWQITALFVPLVHNITESSIYRDQNLIWLLFIVVVVSTCIKFRRDNE